MPEELILADIQQAFLEYRSNFTEPIIPFWYGERHGDLVHAVYKALSPWHLGLENITWNQSPKNASEIQLTFALPALLTSIHVSAAGITVNAFNVAWSN